VQTRAAFNLQLKTFRRTELGSWPKGAVESDDTVPQP